MRKSIKTITAAIVAAFIPTVLFAQGIKSAGGVLDKVVKKAGVDDGDNLGGLVGTGISAALTLVGIIFLILMVYAGYLWMTARGEEDQVKRAQQIIIAAVIGLVITISSYAVTVFITGRFGDV